MATVTETTGAEAERLATAHRSTTTASGIAFRALLLRDLTVLRKTLNEFLPRTVLQPFLLVFVFTYVFPKIGQGVGGAGSGGPAASAFATLLVAGVVGVTILFQGIQSVALPMVQEFGYTKEIEDRVLAPLPVSMVALAKVTSGAIQGLIAALIVFPIAAVVPANPVHLHVNWLVLLTLAPLACITASALGLTFGTRFEPRTVPLMFGVVVIPLTFLGCVYYSWTALGPIKVGGFSWLKFLVLINPLVYMCEGFRAALTTAPHMSLAAVYLVLAGFAALFLYLGINGFKKRVLS
ncbi:MAG TPA: ABC transporter permease [Acidimicrobiia bacterium]|jgi:ABC-2 type transport system permease protein|nr:ABC transporter permease [Acidimicrobiia bacterium]